MARESAPQRVRSAARRASAEPDAARLEARRDLFALLHEARVRRATDLHIATGMPISARIDGVLQPIGEKVLDAAGARRLACALLDPAEEERLEEAKDIDVIRLDPERRRHRMNVAFHNDAVGAVIRLLPVSPIPLAELRLPPIVDELAHRGKGLVLVTGSTSMGKTTTMASLLDQINRSHGRHIITIEDPIEYWHESLRSVVRQREVGKDMHSFADGLRAARRQDPDVILIGEMRDFETIEIALRAAESGVLVISTLHIITVERLMDRVLTYCPPGREGFLRGMLAEALQAVIHQELLPTRDGGKRVACEILVASRAVRNILKSGSDAQLRSQMQIGRGIGMVSMEQSVNDLLLEEAITEEVAERVLRTYASLA